MIREWIARISRDSAVKETTELKADYEVVKLELGTTRTELRKVKEELEDVKLKKKIEEEDIKHLTKIRLEQNEIEFQKKTLELERKKDSEVMTLKQGYADKMQTRLEKETENIKGMYDQILKRIPDVNVRLKGEV